MLLQAAFFDTLEQEARNVAPYLLAPIHAIWILEYIPFARSSSKSASSKEPGGVFTTWQATGDQRSDPP